MLRTPLAFALLLASTPTITTAQGGVWVDRMLLPNVGQCTGALLSFDPQRNETVWFGRLGCRETWAWNGATWTQRATPSAAAPPAALCAGAWDSVRQVVVAVFGNQSTGLQTWEWDGLAWQLRMNGGLPARYAFGLAFDAARNVTVLFGGRDGGSDGYADLWAWNGSMWTQIMFGGPSPRSSVGMAYDAQRQTVLLFGGEGPINGTNSVHGDTWEWNGSYWFNHYGIAAPPARRALGHLAYDSLRNRTLLHGGTWLQGAHTDTWEWNGSAWTQLQPQGNPGAFSDGMVHDRARGVVVLLAATVPPSPWEYVPGNTVPATFAPYGTGCAGPAGVPQIDNVAGSLPRIGSTLQLRVTNLPPSFLNLPVGFLGFDAASWNGIPLPLSLTPLGFTGCSALLAPVLSEALQNTGGVADWNIALPMNALALGIDVYFQCAVLVPGWNLGGFVFSSGGHAVVGSP